MWTSVSATDLSTDKARYAPGEEVILSIPGADKASVTLLHLNEPPVIVWDGKMEDGQVRFHCPSQDYTGYLLMVNTEGKSGYIALDVSSDPLRFPRYGYIWDFGTGTDAEDKITAMNRYHINLVQYYDWQYRHHVPLAEDLNGWADWSGRWIDGKTVRSYLEVAHKHGMKNMAYNMMYAANCSYLNDNSSVDPAWRLIQHGIGDFTFTMSSELGDVGILQFMNPLDQGWQNYIFARMEEVFDTLPFDGWHADTIGEYGSMRTASGEPLGLDEDDKPIYFVKDTYTKFINAAKDALPETYIAFNPVGAQGIEKVSQSNVDILYAEFWPGDKNADGNYYLLYDAIQKEIFKAAEDSGGKSLVVAGYVNYKNPALTFNTPAVVLMDAVCYASGGARIELGNGNRMLSNEYFPGDMAKDMDEELQQRTVRMYDFITAYENVLRDGQVPIDCQVAIAGANVSSTSKKDTVWAFAMADEKRTICHLINLIGSDNVWRDDKQTKNAPERLEGLSVKWYIEKGSSLWLASPDSEYLAPMELSFTRGEDEGGAYILFEIPVLEYWNMICLER